MSSTENQPLLRHNSEAGRARQDHGLVEVSYNNRTRRETRRFLSSKYGHYAVLILVSLDVSCIFADFLIGLYICDHKCEKGENVSNDFHRAQDFLGIVSLIFSCLFMVELLASVWAFGFS